MVITTSTSTIAPSASAVTASVSTTALTSGFFQNILDHLDADSKQKHADKYLKTLEKIKSTCATCLSLFETETKHTSNDQGSIKSTTASITLKREQINANSLLRFYESTLFDLREKLKSIDKDSAKHRNLRKFANLLAKCLPKKAKSAKSKRVPTVSVISKSVTSQAATTATPENRNSTNTSLKTEHAQQEEKSANSKPLPTGSVISKAPTATPENHNSTNTSLKTEHVQIVWEEIYNQLAENLKQAKECLNQAKDPRRVLKGCFVTQTQLKQDVNDLISTIKSLNFMLDTRSAESPRVNSKKHLQDLKPFPSRLKMQINSIERRLKLLEDEQNMITAAETMLFPLTRDILKSTNDTSDVARLENTGIL